MDRVIKFRAKQKHGTEIGKWWYGYFAKDHTGTSYITTLDGVDTAIVDEHTLGQFTGLTDKNGVEIYEGDKIKWTLGKHYWEAVISTVPNNKSTSLYAIETFHNVSIGCDESGDEIYTYERSDDRKGIRKSLEFLSRSTEVIGNIHEESEVQ